MWVPVRLQMELALLSCLVLAANTESPTRLVDEIAKAYIAWHRSGPFDLGMTCGRALAFANGSASASASANARKYNMANGALMRCAPIAAWASTCKRVSPLNESAQFKETAALATADANLTHPNPVCIAANVAFCAALVHLFTNPGDSKGALNKSYEVVERCNKEPRLH
jgi:ADP-ribosyl-[dinitrogen reductase] hydrolase